MRTTIIASLAILAGGGCTEAERSWQETLPAPDLQSVLIESDRGLVRYDGNGPADAVDASLRSWAVGSSKTVAERKLDAIGWELQASEGVLQGAIAVPAAKSGLDLDLAGPSVVDTEILVYHGEIELIGIEGQHIVTADRVFARDLHGAVDLFAGREGLDAELFLDPGSYNALQSYGDHLIVRLPEEGDYTIEVFGDPQYGMVVRDLGFDEVFSTFDYFYGVKGTGETVIEAVVVGGGFYLFAADPTETGTDADPETTTRR